MFNIRLEAHATYWKIPSFIADDKDLLDIDIEVHALKLSNNDPDWKEKIEILVAMDGEDIVNDQKTVRLIYTP